MNPVGVPSLPEVQAYVLRCADILGVDCPVRVKRRDLPNTLWAICEHDGDNPRSVRIVYGPKLEGAGARTWRLTVAHELAHAHLRKLKAPLRSMAPRRGRSGFLAWYESAEEDVVEGLEPVLARLLPDPPWL